MAVARGLGLGGGIAAKVEESSAEVGVKGFVAGVEVGDLVRQLGGAEIGWGDGLCGSRSAEM